MKTRVRLPKYVTRDLGPDGKERFYYRRLGKPKVRINGIPWTPPFMAEYNAAAGGPDVVAITARPIQPQRTGTFSWWCDRYYESQEFKALDNEISKPRRKAILSRICKMATKPNNTLRFGDVQLTSWNKKAVRAIRDRYSETPGAANDMLKAIRAVFVCAMEDDESGIDISPARDVKLLPLSPDGHHSWTIEEVEKFEQKHEVGTWPRLALGLFLYCSQRLSDAIRFGPEHIKLRDVYDDEGNQLFDDDGQPTKRKWLVFTQHKNRNRKPVHMEIPLRQELEELLAASPIGTKTFLVGRRGEPLSRNMFLRYFAEACNAAGVPGRSHGLRKASAVRLAERGATEKEIASITGHTTLQEVQRYTKAASQKRLAASATEKMKPTKGKVA